jgi:hypothetical protein
MTSSAWQLVHLRRAVHSEPAPEDDVEENGQRGDANPSNADADKSSRPTRKAACNPGHRHTVQELGASEPGERVEELRTKPAHHEHHNPQRRTDDQHQHRSRYTECGERRPAHVPSIALEVVEPLGHRHPAVKRRALMNTCNADSGNEALATAGESEERGVAVVALPPTIDRGHRGAARRARDRRRRAAVQERPYRGGRCR